MKAPDKIYISKNENVHGRLFDDDTEYIRKDALIEWLNDSIKEMDEGRKESALLSMAGAVAISSFIEVKNKINSM